MRSHLGFPTLANWVAMLRADVDGAICLTDENGDEPFYESCVHASARVFSSPGMALRLMSDVRERGVQGLVATKNARPGELIMDVEDVFTPGLGDVPSLLLAANCCDRVLEDIAGTAWFRAAEKQVRSLRDRAISIAWKYQQLLRSSSLLAGAFPVEDFVDWAVLDLAAPLAEARFGSGATAFLQALPDPLSGMSLEQMLRESDGMDVVRVLARATTTFRPRGLIANRAAEPDDILVALRVAYNFADFERDPMFWRMRRWERHNPRFPLLREWRLLDPLQVIQDQRYWETDLRVIMDMDLAGEGLSVFKMDLDGFKVINEELGHSRGDEAIRVYCRTVLDTLRETAEVYRRGGDEVVALAPGLRQPAAATLAEELRARIELAMEEWGTEHALSKSVTASIGLVDVDPGCSFEMVVELMDKAQTEAKAGGKNRVIVMSCKADDTSVPRYDTAEPTNQNV